MRRAGNRGASAAYDAAGVESAVEAALSSLGARKPLVSVAIYERPLTTTLLKLVMAERRIQGSLCYTADDFRNVIGLMAAGHYDTSGWVIDVLPAVNGEDSRLSAAVHAAFRVVSAPAGAVLRGRLFPCPGSCAGTPSPLMRASPRASTLRAAFTSA